MIINNIGLFLSTPPPYPRHLPSISEDDERSESAVSTIVNLAEEAKLATSKHPVILCLAPANF